MSAILQDFNKRVFQPRVATLWFFASVIVAVSGPFGSYQVLAFPERLAYWALVIGLAIIAAHAVLTVVESF